MVSVLLFFRFSSTCYAWYAPAHTQMGYEALKSLAGEEKAHNIAAFCDDPDFWLSSKLGWQGNESPYNYGHRIKDYILPKGFGEELWRLGAEEGAAYWAQCAREAYQKDPTAKKWQRDLGYACHFLADAMCPPHCTERDRYDEAQDSHSEFEKTYNTIPDKFVPSLRNSEQKFFFDSIDIENWLIEQAHKVRAMGPPQQYSSLLTFYDDDKIEEILADIGAGIKGLYNFVISEETSDTTSEEKWIRTFGDEGYGIGRIGRDDVGTSVQQTSDGGYIITGYTGSYGSGKGDVWLIKTGAKGNILWERTFGGEEDDWGCSVQQTRDGGYIIAGYTESYGSGKGDVLLIKTDKEGNKVWDKAFGGEGFDYGYSVQQTKDGGYIIAGYTGSYGSGNGDVWLIKTDAEGSMLWDRTFGGEKKDEGKSVQQTKDGGYIITGYTESYGSGSGDVWLIKTDAEGNKIWDRTFGGEGYEEGNSVQQTRDGGYIIAGETSLHDDADILLIKTDAQGNKVWERLFGDKWHYENGSCIQTRDGGYIIAGYTESYGSGGKDVWLIKTDTNGNKMWERTFSGEGHGWGGYSVQQTRDGGYIITGETSLHYEADILLIKTDAEGNTSWDKEFSSSEEETPSPEQNFLGGEQEEKWIRIFGSEGNDGGKSVQQTKDGGYIITGWTNPQSDNKEYVEEGDVLLVKTDTRGNVLWERAFGGEGYDCGNSVQQTKDDGYIIAGYTESYGSGSMDVWLIKTDTNGNKMWDRTFGGALDDKGYSVQQTKDGGYIIAGYTESYSSGKRDVLWLIKTDEEGNMLWDNVFNGEGIDFGYSVQQTEDGGYIIVGGIYTLNHDIQIYSVEDVWLIKTDSEGNKLWDKTFGGGGGDLGYSVQQTRDGGYIIAGCTGSHGYSSGLVDVWLIKTDAEGNKVWDKAFGGEGFDYGYSVQQTRDGGYIIAGYTESYGSGGRDVWLIKTDSEGNKLWDKTFDGGGNEEGNSVQQTKDGGYIIAGYTESYGLGREDVWLIKTDAQRNTSWDKEFSSSEEETPSPEQNFLGGEQEEKWIRTFGGEGNEWSNCVQQTKDGGYITVGYTDSYGSGGGDVWLIKTDAEGNKTWERTFGGQGCDWGSYVQQTRDGGYIITGCAGYYGSGSGDVWLIKTDAEGNKLWDKTFGGEEYDCGNYVQQTRDGGYTITGITDSYGSGSWDVWLIKTDAEGNKLWDKTFGGGGNDWGELVQQTRDGGYIIVGVTGSYGSGSFDVLLVKTDAQGNMLWKKTFGGKGDDGGFFAQQTRDGGYIIAGKITSSSSGKVDVWLIKTDSEGNKLWDKTFGGGGNDWGESIQQTRDGGYIIVGVTDSYGSGMNDIWLIRTDAQGNKIWDKAFGGEEDDSAYSVQQTRDDGYIIAGKTTSYGLGKEDVLLIKTDAQGNTSWDKEFSSSEEETLSPEQNFLGGEQEEKWIRIFGSEGNDGGTSVQQTKDGGYIITGWTNPQSDNKWYEKEGDVLLVKTDTRGNILWEKTFGGERDEWGNSVQQTEDSDYIITGYTESHGSGVWLIKTDAQGNMLWDKIFRDSYGTSVQQTRDGVI